MNRFRSWFAVLGALVVSACGSDDVVSKGLAEGCVLNTDCAAPLVCAFRKCHTACQTSRDCQPGQRCVASDRPYHVCQLDEERACKLNSDCPERQLCGVDLECRDQCAADRDCVKEQLCIAGTCAEPREVSEGGLKNVLTEAGAAAGHPCNYTSECPGPLVCSSQLCVLECITVADCARDKACRSNRCVPGPGALIGPEGGMVSDASGKVTLTILPNSLAAPVSIQILPLDAYPDGALGPVFEIIPSGLKLNPPATLTYHYVPADIGTASPADLRIGVALRSTWTPLVSVVDPTQGLVSASLEHLSVYGIIAVAKAPANDDAGKPDVSVMDAGPDVPGPSLDVSVADAAPDTTPLLDVSVVDAPLDTAPLLDVAIAAPDASAEGSVDSAIDAAPVVDVLATDVSNPCPGATPTVVGTAPGGIYGIAVDGTDVYWSNRTGSVSSIFKAPLGGLDGSAPPALVSSLDIYQGVFVDGSGVYFSANSADNIWSIPLTGVSDGGMATSLAPGQSQQPRAVFGFGGDLYWVNVTYSGAPSIRAVPMVGGATRIIASFPAGTSLVGQALFVDATGVYFATSTTIYHAPLSGVPDGGVVPTVATGLASPGQLLADGVDVYWTEGFASSSVKKAPIDGSLPPTTLANGFSYATAIALDVSTSYIYFAAGLGPAARIVKLPKAGGVMTPITCAQQDMFDIALSGANVYFPSGSSILTVPK